MPCACLGDAKEESSTSVLRGPGGSDRVTKALGTLSSTVICDDVSEVLAVRIGTCILWGVRGRLQQVWIQINLDRCVFPSPPPPPPPAHSASTENNDLLH